MFTRMGRAIKRAILGPSPVAYAHVGLSFSAGLLEGEGVYILRPSWIIDPYWALEGFAGLSPRSEKDVYLGGLGVRAADGARRGDRPVREPRPGRRAHLAEGRQLRRPARER